MIRIGAVITRCLPENRLWAFIVIISIKAKEDHDEAEAMSSYKSEEGATPVGTTLGELLKAKMTGGGK